METSIEKNIYAADLKREETMCERFHNDLMSKLKWVLALEARRGGKRIPPLFRIKYLVTPEQYMRKAFVKLSLASLYRRYRQVRMDALTECLCIAHKETDRDVLVAKIRDKIIEIGTAHKETKKLKGKI